jgi:hypothetical protein
MEEIIEEFKDCAQIAQAPKIEGKMITATIEPQGGAEKTEKSDKAEKTEKSDKAEK